MDVRDAVEAGVRAALDATGHPYELLACAPELADTATFCVAYGFAPQDAANTIVVEPRGDPSRRVACVVLATSRIDVNRTVKQRLGAGKASFADPAAVAELTGMEIGGVTAAGLPEGMPLWIDPAVLERDRVAMGGGSRRWKVVLAPQALLDLPGAEVVEGLARPLPTDP